MQYGFALPRVRRTACLTACQWVNFPDSTTHRWERESQLAWSAYWARRCIWSPQGCPWKRHRAVWAHSETGLTPNDRATCTTPQRELQTKTRSHKAAVSEKLVTEEKGKKDPPGSPLRLQHVNNFMLSDPAKPTVLASNYLLMPSRLCSYSPFKPCYDSALRKRS